MAKDDPNSTEGWDRIPTGGIAGDEWDFGAAKVLIGTYVGTDTVTTKTPRSDGTNVASALVFDVNGHRHFVWETAQLKHAFGQDPETGTSYIREGDEVRIEYMGKGTTSDGRPMHNYSVMARPVAG